MNTKEFIRKAKLTHGDIYDYSLSEYVNSKEKIKILCRIHGEFKSLPHNHMKRSGCPQCGKIQSINKQSKSQDKFLEEAKKLHKNKYDYTKVIYTNQRNSIEIVCDKHGIFKQSPYVHLRGAGCKLCSRLSTTSTLEKFIKKASLKHNNKYNYSLVLYKNSKKKVNIICPEHGSFLQIPNGHLNGSGCPQCGSKYVSENKLFQFLKSNLKTKVVLQYKTDWLKLQSIDIFIPEYNIGIEYQGIQHFKPIRKFGGIKKYTLVLERDVRKLRLCKENNCNLLYFNYFPKEVPSSYIGEIFTDESVLLKKIKKLWKLKKESL